MAGDVGGVAQRQRAVAQPVFGHDGAVRQPSPAQIRRLEKPGMDKFAHHPLPGFVRHLPVELGSHHQRVSAVRIELQRRFQPAHHPVVIECTERDADSGLVIKGLQVQY